MTSETIDLAKSRVTIFDAARHFGHDIKPGSNKSPFRDVKSGEPFSVPGRGRFWRDHGIDKGGDVISYIQLAMGNANFVAAATLLCRLAGVDPETQEVRKLSSRTHRRHRQKARERARAEYTAQLNGEDQVFKGKALRINQQPVWSPEMAVHWGLGRTGEHLTEEVIDRLNQERGWPVGFTQDLITAGKLARPLVPWAERGGTYVQHGWAWLVERPRKVESGCLVLEPLGWHQRYRQSEACPKAWIYVPCRPRNPRTEFQRHLVDLDLGCPALPFVMGNLQAPKVVAILEGEWDAATLYLAARKPGLCVLGVRGVSGTDPLLASYGAWLRRVKPVVWLICDSDDAGARWLPPTSGIRPKGERPRFYDRLRAMGLRIVVSRVDLADFDGNDFNDYYRAKQPDEFAIHEWMMALGLPEVM